MSVSDRFSTLLSWTNLTDAQVNQYNSHIATVKTRLKTVFGATNVPIIGSHSRESATAQSSDVDLLLTLPVDAVKWGSGWKLSTTVLDEVRAQLEDRYTQTEVQRDGQAVRINFGNGEYPIDVVPGVYAGALPDHSNYPSYYIADGTGQWMKTAPQAHNKYITAADVKSGGKLKNVAKLLKYWRHRRTPAIPLNSFHIELLLAQEQICEVGKSYAKCVADALKLLYNRDCRALQDPLGISGLVPAGNTNPKVQRIIASAGDSADHAQRALNADGWGSYSEAYSQWDMVFNGGFPKS